MDTESEKIIQVVGFGTVVLLLVTAFLVSIIVSHNLKRNRFLIEKKKLESQLMSTRVEIQEETFNTLSRELHDNVGQLLSTSKMLLLLTEKEMTYVPDTFRTASETVAKAITELRTIAKTLDKNWLESFDIRQNLVAEVDRINANHKIHAVINYNIEINLMNERQLLLYRIIQEGIQNVIKHANACNIHIDISQDKQNQIVVSIADDGAGFNVEDKQGLGLRNMSERAKLLKGSLSIQSRKGEGTKIEILIPVDETSR